MKAVRIYAPGEDPVIESIPIPEPGPGEVLVKMTATPINPSDLASITRGYAAGSWPFTPGLEGAGVVVRAGRGILPRLRKGKTVACSPIPGRNGTWAEYMLTTATRVVPLPRNLDPAQGAMMLVNPMTALAFIDMARKEKHAAMVNNAAASALGKILIRLAKQYSIPLINIVRKEEHVALLTGMGADHVLNSGQQDFETKLESLCARLGGTLIFDAVGGPGSAKLLHAAPEGATLVLYSRLSGDLLHARPSDLIIPGKTITGFQLARWLSTKSTLSTLRFVNRVKNHLADHLETEIAEKVAIENTPEAIHRYSGNMSGGKILIVFDKP